jgi:hypothetical protein
MVAAMKGIKKLLYQDYDPLRYIWSSSLIIKRNLDRMDDPLRGWCPEYDPLRRGSKSPKGIKGIIQERLIPFAADSSLVSPSFTFTDALPHGRGVGSGPATVGTSGTFSIGVTQNRGLRLAIEKNLSVSFHFGGAAFEK